ncbi:MAG: hypothetical protein HC802_21740 [Caldilineaceae bacterium]|nr:hypothetical protein [Caldilineaceae bacterium]
MGAKETYQAEVKARVKKLDAQIQEMAGKLDKASSDTQAEYRRQVNALKERRSMLQDRLTELQEASDAAWSDLRSGVDEAMTALSDAIADAQAQFSQDKTPQAA